MADAIPWDETDLPKANNSKTSKKSTRGKKPVKSKSSNPRRSRNTDNDPGWYNANGQLTMDVSNYSFNNPIGSPLHLDSYYVTGNNEQADVPDFYASGICSLRVVPCVGSSFDGNSAVNIASRALYSYVRHANSGAANYDWPDLMLYCLSAANMYAFHGWMTRLYGYLNLYSFENKYLPDALIAANGVQPTDLRKNMAQFRAYINTYAAKLSSYAVPDSMPIFARYTWLFQNLYKDDNTMKSGLYQYVPDCFLQYDETSSSKGGRLIPVHIPDPYAESGITFTSLMTIGNKLMSAFVDSQDIGIMSGDIIKAYGDGNLLKCGQIDDAYVVMPDHNAEVLNQIHNAKALGMLDVSDTMVDSDLSCVYQDPDTNNLYAYWVMKYGAATTEATMAADGVRLGRPWASVVNGAKFLIDIPTDNPSPDEVMVSSRLMATTTCGPLDKNSNKLSEWVIYSGSDFVTTFNITLFNDKSTSKPAGQHWGYHRWMAYSSTDGSNVQKISAAMSRLSNFSMYPEVNFTTFSEGKVDATTMMLVDNYGTPCIDLYNSTTITSDDLERMHATAMLSLFGVSAK